jgi:hypothetical protein
VRFSLPEVVVEGERVTVTPMRFAAEDLPFGAQVIAPFLGGLQPLREALTTQLLEEDCRNESSLLVLDIVLGVLSGSGSLELEAGGVEAFTADTDFSSPPLELPPTDTAAEPPVQVADAVLDTGLDLDIATFDPGALDEVALDGFDTEVAQAPPVTTPAPTTTLAGRTDEVAAATLAPATFEDSDAGAAAAAVGLVGLLVAIGLSTGERWKLRRNPRRIP